MKYNEMDWFEYFAAALRMLLVVCVIAIMMAVAYKAICWIV